MFMASMFNLHKILSCARMIMVSFMLLSLPVAADVRDAEEFFFSQSFGDFSEELESARAAGKKGVLIMFELDECPFCHRMRTTVLSQSKVQDYFREYFSIFHVDIEGDVEITDFSGNTITEKDFAFKINRVRATPVFAFYDLSGKRVTRYTGATSGVEEFMLLGKYVVDEVYRTMSFNRYKKEHKPQ